MSLNISANQVFQTVKKNSIWKKKIPFTILHYCVLANTPDGCNVTKYEKVQRLGTLIQFLLKEGEMDMNTFLIKNKSLKWKDAHFTLLYCKVGLN